MSGTKIIFIRHGETEENVAGEVAGTKPGTLTEKGRRQAEALAEILAAENVSSLYSSDLGRARETAEIASARAGRTGINIDERLREEDASGRTEHYVRHLISAKAIPESLKSRISAFIFDIERECPGTTVAAFTHFGPMFAVLISYGGVAPKDAARRLANTARVVYQNGEIS